MASAFAYSNADCLTVDSLANPLGIVSYRNSCSEYNLDRNISRQRGRCCSSQSRRNMWNYPKHTPLGQYSCTGIFNDVSSGYPNDLSCYRDSRESWYHIKNDFVFDLSRALHEQKHSLSCSIVAGLNFRSTLWRLEIFKHWCCKL